MRAAGEVRKCAVVLAEALTTGSCKLAAMFCAVVRFDAFPVVLSHTHNCHPDSYRPSNWHLRLSVRLKGHAPIGVGSSPYFSALAPYLFPSLFFFLPLTQFLCAVFVCMQWGVGPLVLSTCIPSR